VETEQITKYTAPNEFDREPFGKIWIEITDDQCPQYWIQLSEDQEHPQWQTMGKFFESVFVKFIDNNDFMEQCLRLFKYHKDRPLNRISDIIKDK